MFVTGTRFTIGFFDSRSVTSCVGTKLHPAEFPQGCAAVSTLPALHYRVVLCLYDLKINLEFLRGVFCYDGLFSLIVVILDDQKRDLGLFIHDLPATWQGAWIFHSIGRRAFSV
jgi:hypothetical protein